MPQDGWRREPPVGRGGVRSRGNVWREARVQTEILTRWKESEALHRRRAKRLKRSAGGRLCGLCRLADAAKADLEGERVRSALEGNHSATANAGREAIAGLQQLAPNLGARAHRHEVVQRLRSGRLPVAEHDHTPDRVRPARRGDAQARDPMRAVAVRYERASGRIMIELANSCVFGFPAELGQGLRGASARARRR